MKKPNDATSGSLTSWVQDLVSEVPFERLVEEAAAVRPDADGLIMLPYFAGERTPIFDPTRPGSYRVALMDALGLVP